MATKMVLPSGTKAPDADFVDGIDSTSFMRTTHAANAITGFGTSGSATLVARSDHAHSGTYEPANTNIQSHISSATGAEHGAVSTATANMIARRDASAGLSVAALTATLGTFSTGINITGNSAIPATISLSPWLTGGFGSPYIGRLYIGDGTGWSFTFSKRASSATTDLFIFSDAGNLSLTGTVTGKSFASSVVTGTAPLTVSSTTTVTNLSSDMVDGKHSTDLMLLDGTSIMTGTLNLGGCHITSSSVINILNGSAAQGINVGQLLVSSAYADVSNVPTNGAYIKGSIKTPAQIISTVATGTAPFSVASSTLVSNLNSQYLNGVASTGYVKIDGSQAITGAQNINNTLTIAAGTTKSSIQFNTPGTNLIGFYVPTADTLGIGLTTSASTPPASPIFKLDASGVQVNGTVNVNGKFSIQYNSTEDSLDFIYN